MSLLDLLPPSPPTTTSRKTMADAPRPFLAPPIVMSTPEDSPASIPGSSNQGSRKKVEFSAQPDICTAAVFASSPEQAASIKTLPPSREHRIGGRSILKAHSQAEVPLVSMDGQQDHKLSVNESMDSIVQQLSKNDKSNSLDAYNALISLFRAYDDLSEAIVLGERLSTLIKYIRRDLGSQDQTDEEPTDTNLILSALKLLIILAWNSTYSPLLSNEAKSFILDRSIHVISEHKASKNVIVHYLHLLSIQNFRPSIMTANNRAGRLLDALKELSHHVTSSAVMSETMMVLGRLTDQARPVVKSKADCWVGILLNAMITPSRDTRQKAISFGMKACSAFATAPSVSSAFRDMLKHETDTKLTVEGNACRRLKALLTKAEDAALVPQAWGTITLLAVDSSESVSEWTSLKGCWLGVIQQCFNSSDSAVRKHANFAWNRLVCLVQPHQASNELVSLLGKPVAGQMERSGRDKQGNESRLSALSSYCNLLYYAFRPAATHKQYTRSWNEYIVKILQSSFLGRSSLNSEFACRVFMALMWNSSRVTKVWRETRAHDNAVVEPEELPTIDAKWLRKNCGAVLQMFKLLFSYSSWTSSTASSQTHIVEAWKHFAKSLGEAASKEIKASADTIQACTQIMRLVQSLWKEGPRTVNASEKDVGTLAERLNFLLRVVIGELGAAPFINVLEISSNGIPASLLQTLASTAVSLKQARYAAENRLGGAYLLPKVSAPTLLLLEKTLSLLDRNLHDVYQAGSNDAEFDQCEIDDALNLLSDCLNDPSDKISVLTMRIMQSSLSLWLEDPNRSTSTDEDVEVARIDIMTRLAGVVIPALAKVPCHLVKGLDGLFAAGFSSTHRGTINQMVDMWNRTKAQTTEITFGLGLHAALTRLKPYVDIDVDLHQSKLPELEVLANSITPPAFLGFMESQSQPTAVEVVEQISTEGDHRLLRNNIDLLTEEVLDGALSPQNLVGAPASRLPSSHSTPQRNRCHDDSQVQFHPIDSSPPTVENVESQYLTERQKDVRNRQRQDASLYFSDLRPDNGPKATHSRNLSSEPDRQEFAKVSRPSTPTLPGRGHTDFDNNPIPSPTPRSKHGTLRLEHIDAPSSPLSVQADEDNSVEGYPHDTSVSILIDELPVTISYQEKFDEDMEGTHTADSTCMHKFSGRTTSTVVPPAVSGLSPVHIREVEARFEVDEEAELASTGGKSHLELPHPEISEAAAEAHRLNSDELDMMSQSQLSQDLEFHISECSDLPEPIATVSEEEPSHQLATSSIAPTSNRKRKRRTSQPARSKKRMTRSSSAPVSDVSHEEQEDILDCIMVDSSPKLPSEGVCVSGKQPFVQNTALNCTPEDTRDFYTPPASSVQDMPSHCTSKTTASGTEALSVHVEAATGQPQFVPQHHAGVQAESDITTTLQHVLERLKQCTGENLDLRTLDDLCFHIRTEAQNASRRWAH